MTTRGRHHHVIRPPKVVTLRAKALADLLVERRYLHPECAEDLNQIIAAALSALAHPETHRMPGITEEVLGPPTRVAFKDGKPTRAAEAFAEKLGVKVEDLRRVDTPRGECLAGTRTLSDEQVEARDKATSEKKPADGVIDIKDFDKIDLRIGTIAAAERIPEKDRLLKLEVSFGDFARTIVAGIAENFHPEDVVGKQSLFVVNLAPRTVGGVESHGMILATKFKETPESKASMALLEPTFPVPPGSKFG